MRRESDLMLLRIAAVTCLYLPVAAAARPSAPIEANSGSHLPTATEVDGAWAKVVLGETVGHRAIYDPIRDRMVVFGGAGVDVWALALSGAPEWTELSPAGAPPSVRGGHSLVYDPVRDRMIVFGGSHSGVYFNDVWELTLGGTPTWNQLTPPSAPHVRSSHTAIYDPLRDRMIVHGGTYAGISSNSEHLGDSWALALSGTPTWTQLPGGPERFAHSAIYDPVRDRMVTFGGTVSASDDYGRVYYNVDDVWELALTGTPTWADLTPADGMPNEPSGHAAVYDPIGDRMLVFGGYRYYGIYASNDVWALTLAGSPTWSELEPSVPPTVRTSHATIYDPTRGRMVVFGGDNGYGQSLDDVWALSLSGSPTWVELRTAGPRERENHTAIYDPARDRMVICGGNDYGSLFGDVWELPLSSRIWRHKSPSGTGPGVRMGHTAIYDPIRDRMVLFGGDGGGIQNDTWALTLSDSPAWTELTPSGTPPTPRSDHAAIYDAARDRMVVFGGFGAGSEVWSLTLSGTPTWSLLTTVGDPPVSRGMHVAIYDPIRDRMLVHGGHTGGVGEHADVWELTFAGTPTWTELTPVGFSPTPRRGHTAIYDPIRDRMVVYGGFQDGPGNQGDAWALSLSGAPAWSELQPGGVTPRKRREHTAVYDPVRDRMLVYGGEDGRMTVWSLHWDEAPTPTLISLSTAHAELGQVRITWIAGDALNLVANVYRSEGLNSWNLVGRISPDGTGRIVFKDTDVVSGMRYGYRLGIVLGGVETFLGETWIEVPASRGFSLAGVRPNPTEGAFHASFALSDGSPAILELMDLSGRRMLRMDVGDLGPGTHLVDLGRGRKLAPGVYIVRLSRAGQFLTTRATVLR
jgi:Galactose oxidase, central domain/Kelch motif